MSLFANLNRKPYSYIKVTHAFEAMETIPMDDSQFEMTRDTIKFDEFWFNRAKPEKDIPETVTVKLITPVVKKGEVVDDEGNDPGYDSATHDGQCMNMPAYLTPSFHKIASDQKLMQAVKKGVEVRLQEYEDSRGNTQVGVIFV